MNRSGLRKVKKRTKDGVVRSYWSRDPHMIRRAMSHAGTMAAHGAVTGFAMAAGHHVGGMIGHRLGDKVAMHGFRKDQNADKYRQTRGRGTVAGKVIGSVAANVAARKLLGRSKHVQAAGAFLERHQDKPGAWLLHSIHAGTKTFAVGLGILAPYIAARKLAERHRKFGRGTAAPQPRQPQQPRPINNFGQRITVKRVEDR